MKLDMYTETLASFMLRYTLAQHTQESKSDS